MCVHARTAAVLRISVNEATLVPYVLRTLKDSALTMQLATRLNPSGADELIVQQFNHLLASGDNAEAARLAAGSPNGERWLFHFREGGIEAGAVWVAWDHVDDLRVVDECCSSAFFSNRDRDEQCTCLLYRGLLPGIVGTLGMFLLDTALGFKAERCSNIFPFSLFSAIVSLSFDTARSSS